MFDESKDLIIVFGSEKYPITFNDIFVVFIKIHKQLEDLRKQWCYLPKYFFEGLTEDPEDDNKFYILWSIEFEHGDLNL
jgi:hypothetical protein